MNQRDREILRINRTFLVDQLEVSTIVDFLYQEHILLEDDLERLRMFHKTNKEKARELLDILPFRGSAAYQCFKDSLRNTGVSNHIVEKLENSERTTSSQSSNNAASVGHHVFQYQSGNPEQLLADGNSPNTQVSLDQTGPEGIQSYSLDTTDAKPCVDKENSMPVKKRESSDSLLSLEPSDDMLTLKQQGKQFLNQVSEMLKTEKKFPLESLNLEPSDLVLFEIARKITNIRQLAVGLKFANAAILAEQVEQDKRGVVNQALHLLVMWRNQTEDPSMKRLLPCLGRASFPLMEAFRVCLELNETDSDTDSSI